MVFCFMNLANFILAFPFDGHSVCLQFLAIENRGDVHIIVYILNATPVLHRMSLLVYLPETSV